MLSNNESIEDLQTRLRNNIETIQILNQQVNSLQRENLLQKDALEKEISARHALQTQLESRVARTTHELSSSRHKAKVYLKFLNKTFKKQFLIVENN